MRFLLSIFLSTIFCFSTSAQVFPVAEVVNNGDDAKRIILSFIGDGYVESELNKYANDVDGVVADLFQATPFKEYAAFFNVYRIEVPSAESGADHPGTATDVDESGNEIIDVDTYFGSTFDWAGIHRLLVPANSGAAFSVLASNTPAYDQGFVLANSTTYGGSGGTLATSSVNGSASEISIHEIGHSFANLKDEYWAGDQFASEGFNMTAESDPAMVKWNIWVGLNNVGVFPYGSSGNQANWYRPHQNCKMRFLGPPFCSICTERIIDKIYSLVQPIDEYSPVETSLSYEDEDLAFSSSIVYPQPNTLEIIWELNGVEAAKDVEDLMVTGEMLEAGENTLRLLVYDKTDLSKKFDNGYEWEMMWTIEKGGTSAIDDLESLPIAISPNPFENFVEIKCECSGNFKYTLLTQSGKKVQEGDILLSKDGTKLDLPSLAKGTYILQLTGEEDNKHIQRILIKS